MSSTIRPDRTARLPHRPPPSTRPTGGDRRNVGGDPPHERAEEDPAQRVVEAGVADEDPSRHPSPLAAPRPCRMTATAAAVAPSRITNLRDRPITTPSCIQRLAL
jgi:hypothetical protein